MVCHVFSICAVPSEAPLNVMLMVESSTAIRVSWEEVPAIDENGIIIMYQVQYDPLETFGGLISINITDTSMLSTVLTDLEEYVEYNISVRAYTSAGPGPYSIGVSNRTETDGKLGNNCSMIYKTSYLIVSTPAQNHMILLRM